ncbi:MAG: bacterial transcriptional activator domain-containing protein, partial [Actinomycetota bacterium]|nr:bacterial transcriptional activator domain-containing protein [Actinomycetota bacterium]
ALGSRVAGGLAGEPWYPMVVLVGPGADPAIVEDLVATATMSCGVAVAGTLGDVETKWQLIVGPDGAAVLKPLGMGMRMSGVADAPAAGDEFVDATLSGPVVDEALWDDTAAHETVVEVDEAMWGSSTDGGVVDEVGVDEAVVHQGPAPHREISAADGSEQVPAGNGLGLDQSGLDEGNIGLAIGAMVAVAEEHDVAAPIPLVAPARSRRARLRRRQDCEVWVSILRREPEVIGSAHAFRSRRKLAEVLVYLVVYGTEHPVAGTQLRTDCWCPKPDSATPGLPPRLKEITMDSLHQAMSRLRKQLGEGARGWHLPAAVDGAYRPGLDVGCDWTLFQALAAAGTDAVARHETARAITAWREALELVAGDPFADVLPLGLYVFAETRPLITDIRLAVAKVADDLARLTREADPVTSVWATEQGHLVLPTQLGLFDHKMAAFAELGDVEGVERALAAKCWAHEQLDPDGGVPPETLELYRHLVARAKDGSRVGASSSRS